MVEEVSLELARWRSHADQLEREELVLRRRLPPLLAKALRGKRFMIHSGWPVLLVIPAPL